MIERALLEYFANSMWQVPILAAAAWFLVLMVRPRVQFEHGLWLAVLAAAVVLPLRGVPRLAEPPILITPVSANEPHQAAVVHEATASEPNATPSIPFPLYRVQLSSTATNWLVWAYLGMIALGSVRLARSWRAARRLVRDAREFIPSPRDAALLEEWSRFRALKLPQILTSERVSAPVIVGVLRPVLLLPPDFEQYTGKEARAVLCHEMAHVKRRDYLVNLVCRFAGLPVSYHPATAMIQRRIRQTREMICDRMAATGMDSANEYATCLVHLAQRIAAGRGIAEEVQAVGMFDNHKLEERVMRLNEWTSDKSASETKCATKLLRIAIGSVAMLTLATAVSMFHVIPAAAATQDPAAPAAATAPSQDSAIQAQAPTETETVPDQDATPAIAPAPPEEPATGAAPAAPAAPSDLALPALPAPPPPLAPASAVPPPAAAPQPPPPPRPAKADRDSQPRDRKSTIIIDGKSHALTPEQQARLQEQLSRIDAEVAAATRKIDSPEFRKQMEELQRKVVEATARIDNPEFRRQIAEASKIADNPEFKKRMEEMDREVADATARIDTPEFRKQIAEASKVADSPEFKKRMEQVDREVAEATARIDSPEFRKQIAEASKIADNPEFKRQMENMQRDIAKATAKINSEEFRQRMADVQKQLQSGDFQRQIDAISRAARDAAEQLKQAPPQ